VLFAIVLLFLRTLFALIYSRSLRLGQLRDIAEMLLVFFLFALPGWFFALPIVVLLKNAQGWRGWFILLVGTCIGPGFIILWSLVESSGHFSWQQQGHGLGLPLMISLPTTACYVIALKFAHRRRMSPEP
jgi:hypothetical protein